MISIVESQVHRPFSADLRSLARSPQGEKLRDFYSPIFRRSASRTSREILYLNRPQHVAFFPYKVDFDDLLEGARLPYVVN